MATTTENLSLTLPAGTDRALVSDLNENFQTLDDFAGQATANIQQAQETANAAAPQATTYTKDEVDAAIEEAIEHGGGGTTDYTELTNKPSINGVVLTGNKTTSDLGIEENVQADWDEADTTAPSYIKNKPNIPAGVVVDTTYDGTSENAQAGTAVAQAISTKVDKVTGKGLSTNDFTNADKAKLDGIESGAEANVQANWTQTDNTADDYIKNKPTIPAPVTVDQTYSATSSNAQSGVAVAQAISTKVDKETGKGLSTNDFTNTDKANLATALATANAAAPQSTTYTKTEVDTALAAETSAREAADSEMQAEIGAVANAGAKNNADFKFGGVVQNANIKPGTIECVESNGTFSFSGTSDDKNYAAYILKQFLLKAGAYKVSGISGGSNTTYWMRIGTGTDDTGLFNLYDAEREFNLVSDTLITIQVVIYANQTVSNLVFKPMIRPASITDDTFVPYAPSNRELYEMIFALQNGG